MTREEWNELMNRPFPPWGNALVWAIWFALLAACIVELAR